ncbi:helix-turn-helix domain-containing protein [Clostridium kluyveri]|uniref:HTH cro/C1-type domain-containing protein n=1 Tax=Clostridium kluyveri TaxID=1534 RepID=A0A1L5F2S7_CLOKL|nr:helix-turn-helix transcriptional regulator [Clostridium kluyveri]APM37309.1 hypothetical protein BS101_00280 [Clostridium kluyveri]
MKYSKLKIKRIEKRISVFTISKDIGISESYYYQIENGSKYPSVKVMKKICKQLDIDPKELFFNDEEKEG